jgi:molybdopterin-biosynthesis enzyme MoeA-like protein
LIVGNEILSGKIDEGNLRPLGQVLYGLGVRLTEATVVSDEVEAIAQQVNRLRSSHDFLFTSGGVGPTHDDVTVAGVAAAFGCDVVVDPTMATLIEAAYRDEITDTHLLMARVPRGATLERTADVRWPVIVKDNVWLLPGVPEVFRMKLAVVRARIPSERPFLSKAAYVGLDESSLKPLLDRVVFAHPAVQVGSYPKWSDTSYKTKVTFDGQTDTEVSAALKAFVAQLPAGEPKKLE